MAIVRLSHEVPADASHVSATRTVAADGSPRAAAEVAATPSAHEVLARDAITVTGTITRSPKGTVVKLQRHSGSAWKTVTTAKVSDSHGRYKLSAKPAAGTNTYSVLRPGTEHTRSSTSESFTLTGDKCAALRKPPTTEVWFTDPKSTAAVSSVTSNIGALICSAAKDSSIDVALFFLDATSKEIDAILRPLELMHRFRGVKVRFLLERRDMPGGLGPSTRARLSTRSYPPTATIPTSPHCPG